MSFDACCGAHQLAATSGHVNGRKRCLTGAIAVGEGIDFDPFGPYSSDDSLLQHWVERAVLKRSISVVIPSYNRPELTARAVQSVVQQDWPVDEIIVVDDGSEPKLSASDLLPQDGQQLLKVLRLDRNSGAAAARSAGVETARGDLIAFLDSDDRWLPGKLRAQMDVIAATLESARDSDLWAIACGWQRDFGQGKDRQARIPIAADGVGAFAAGCWFCPGSTTIIPRTAFSRVGGFNTKMRRLEDYEWFIRFGQAGGRLVVADYIGADISMGRRASIRAVKKARKFVLDSTSASSLSTGASHDMKAYLALEMAKAAHNEGKPVQTALWLLQSFWHRPRLQLVLRNWWR